MAVYLVKHKQHNISKLASKARYTLASNLGVPQQLPNSIFSMNKNSIYIGYGCRPLTQQSLIPMSLLAYEY